MVVDWKLTRMSDPSLRGMDIDSSTTALITGANRGIGREFARQLLERGATVYAAARDVSSIDLPGVTALRVDITDPASVEAAAARAHDVDLLVNNAGITTLQNLLTGDRALVRAEMETNFWGTLDVTRAFAPVLAANGGGAIINVLSVLSFKVFPGNGAYSASKAAAWALTNSTRLELAEQGTQVLGLHMSSTDTDMMAGWDIPKNDPADVVRSALEGLVDGAWEVLADDDTVAVKQKVSGSPKDMYEDVLQA